MGLNNIKKINFGYVLVCNNHALVNFMPTSTAVVNSYRDTSRQMRLTTLVGDNPHVLKTVQYVRRR